MQDNKNNQMRVVKNDQMGVVVNNQMHAAKNNQVCVVENIQMHAVIPKRKKLIDNAHKEKDQLELIKCNENTILKEFAKILEVTPEQIREESKRPAITEMRYLYCKLRYEMHGVTYKSVGHELGRSYSTVWYGVNRINDLLHHKDKIIVDMWDLVKNIGELL